MPSFKQYDTDTVSKEDHDIITKYKKLQTEAVEFRNLEDRISRVTMTEMSSRTSNSSNVVPDNVDPKILQGSKILDKIYSGIGPRCVHGNASQIYYVLFPPNAKWFELTIPDPVLTTLLAITGKATGENIAQIQDAAKSQVDIDTEKMAKVMLDRMNLDQVHVSLQKILERVIVGGQCILHIMSEGGSRLIPFKNFVTKRKESKLIYAIICEKDGDTTLYTYVDYEENSVWQLDEESKRATKISDKATQYIVAVSNIHEYENFSTGYAANYVGQIELCNYLRKAIQEGAQLESLVTLVCDAGNNSTIKPAQLAKFLNGGIFSGDVTPDGKVANVAALSFPNKIIGYQWIGQWCMEIEKELENDFAIRLFNQAPDLPQMTATQVIRMSQDLDRNINSHVAVLRQTLQVPLVKAYMSILKFDRYVIKKTENGEIVTYFNGPNEKDGEKIYQVSPIGGLSVLTKQMQVDQIKNLLDWFEQRVGGPMIANQYIDYPGITKHFCDLSNLPTELIFKPNVDSGAVPAMLNQQNQQNQIKPRSPA